MSSGTELKEHFSLTYRCIKTKRQAFNMCMKRDSEEQKRCHSALNTSSGMLCSTVCPVS